MDLLLKNYMIIVCNQKYNIVQATSYALQLLKYDKIEDIRSKPVTIIMPSISASFHTNAFKKIVPQLEMDKFMDATDKINNTRDYPETYRCILTVNQLEKALSKESSIKELVRKDGSSIYVRIYVQFQHTGYTLIYMKALSKSEEMIRSSMTLSDLVYTNPNLDLDLKKNFHNIDDIYSVKSHKELVKMQLDDLGNYSAMIDE